MTSKQCLHGCCSCEHTNISSVEKEQEKLRKRRWRCLLRLLFLLLLLRLFFLYSVFTSCLSFLPVCQSVSVNSNDLPVKPDPTGRPFHLGNKLKPCLSSWLGHRRRVFFSFPLSHRLINKTSNKNISGRITKEQSVTVNFFLLFFRVKFNQKCRNTDSLTSKRRRWQPSSFI